MRGREKNDWGLCVHVSVSQECNQTYCHVLGTRLVVSRVVSPREYSSRVKQKKTTGPRVYQKPCTGVSVADPLFQQVTGVET